MSVNLRFLRPGSNLSGSSRNLSAYPASFLRGWTRVCQPFCNNLLIVLIISSCVTKRGQRRRIFGQTQSAVIRAQARHGSTSPMKSACKWSPTRPAASQNQSMFSGRGKAELRSRLWGVGFHFSPGGSGASRPGCATVEWTCSRDAFTAPRKSRHHLLSSSNPPQNYNNNIYLRFLVLYTLTETTMTFKSKHWKCEIRQKNRFDFTNIRRYGHYLSGEVAKRERFRAQKRPVVTTSTC